jgi:Ran GTPase-activating protein (RanGAP) involved in mRNA processing and transport
VHYQLQIMNVLIEDLVKRLSANSPCLQHVSLQRLPLAYLSATEVRAIVQALADNHVVDSLDVWFPNENEEEDYNHDNEEDNENDDVESRDIHEDTTCYSYLIDALSCNTSIRHLSVSSASDAAWKALFIGLSNNVSVQTLELGDAAAFEPDHVEWSTATCWVAATMLQTNTSVQKLTMRGFSLLKEDNDGSGVDLLAAGFAKNTTLQSIELHQIAGLADSQLLSMLNAPSIRIIMCDLATARSKSTREQQKQPYQLWTNLLSSNTKLQALRLIECCLTSAQIRDLSNGLGRDNLSDRDDDDSSNCKLSLLDLRGNVLQDASCQALATALQYNTSLTKLILQDTSLTNAGLAKIAVGLGRNQSLTKLNLRGNHLQGELGCEALANALSPASSSSSSSSFVSSSSVSALQVLDVSKNNIGNAGAAALGRLLSTDPTALQELHTESCDMTGSGVAALAQGLRQNTHLQEWNLCQNSVDAKAAKVVASMLECNKSLTTLNLSGCSVSDESASSLATALTHNETLQELALSFNRIGNVGVKALANMLPSTRLSSLALQFNMFDNDGLEHFITGLAQNVYLKDLFVMNAHSYCSRTDACMREIVHYLSLNRAGRRCLIEAHPAKASIWPHILQRADDRYGTNAIFYLLREQPDLVLDAAAPAQKK